MASIVMMFGGAVINGVALAEKTRHDKALEAYESAQARYSQERSKLLD